MLRRINQVIALALTFCMVFEQSGFAQIAPQLPIPAYLQGFLSPDRFRPMHLRSISFDRQDLDFSLYLDKGDLPPKPKDIRDTSRKVFEYFQVGLRLPNSLFWVNLRPDSPDEIIEPELERTDLGEVLLAADLQLKKDVARFTSPETDEGRQYWDRLYARAEGLFGQEDVEIPTYTRPWIVPGEIIVKEAGTSAYIYKATLNVMLEQDYLKEGLELQFNDPRAKELNEYSSELIRELIIPRLTREVNSAKKYAQLRQVYYSLVLAQWFKAKFRGSDALLSNIDSRDLSGLESKKKWSKQTYFKKYKKSFHRGEYDVQESVSGPSGMTIRRYFSGGTDLTAGAQGIQYVGPRDLIQAYPAAAAAQIAPLLSTLHAMTVDQEGVLADGGNTLATQADEKPESTQAAETKLSGRFTDTIKQYFLKAGSFVSTWLYNKSNLPGSNAFKQKDLPDTQSGKDGGNAAELKQQWEAAWKLYDKAATINKDNARDITRARNGLGKVAQEIIAQPAFQDAPVITEKTYFQSRRSRPFISTTETVDYGHPRVLNGRNIAQMQQPQIDALKLRDPEDVFERMANGRLSSKNTEKRDGGETTRDSQVPAMKGSISVLLNNARRMHESLLEDNLGNINIDNDVNGLAETVRRLATSVAWSQDKDRLESSIDKTFVLEQVIPYLEQFETDSPYVQRVIALGIPKIRTLAHNEKDGGNFENKMQEIFAKAVEGKAGIEQIEQLDPAFDARGGFGSVIRENVIKQLAALADTEKVTEEELAAIIKKSPRGKKVCLETVAEWRKIDGLFADALRGDKAAYRRIQESALADQKAMIEYFEAQAETEIAAMPKDIFGIMDDGKGYGYDVRGNALKVKDGDVNLKPVTIYLIGKALATLYARPGDTGLITGDQRWHTPALRLAMALGASAAGVNVDFSNEILGTGEHGLLSGENPYNHTFMVQISGSHGIPEKNGLKIKVDDNGRLEPLYVDDLAKLYFDSIARNSFRSVETFGNTKEISGLINLLVDYYDKSLPQVDAAQPMVIDCRNSALVPVLKLLTARRGLKNVRWLNDTPDPAMPGGIWDPSKREALLPASEAVRQWNKELEAQGSAYRAVGFVFDGDGDRATAIIEDGSDIPAFEMTLPFYQRFISDPINQRVVDKLRTVDPDYKIWLVSDIRATSTLTRMIDRYPAYAGYYLQPGYPPQRDFVRWRIEEMRTFIESDPSLKNDAQLKEDFQHFANTYFTAEASGHQFFHICPNYPEKVIDAGIAVMFNLLNIKQTIQEIEAKDEKLNMPAKETYSLVDLFKAFPQAIASEEIRIIVPNSIKWQLTLLMTELMQKHYADRLLPSPKGMFRVGRMLLQPKEEGAIALDGLVVKLKDGSSALFRKSNTGEQATLMFEGSTPEALISLMEEIERLTLQTMEGMKKGATPEVLQAIEKVNLADLKIKTESARKKYAVGRDGGTVAAKALKAISDFRGEAGAYDNLRNRLSNWQLTNDNREPNNDYENIKKEMQEAKRKMFAAAVALRDIADALAIPTLTYDQLEDGDWVISYNARETYWYLALTAREARIQHADKSMQDVVVERKFFSVNRMQKLVELEAAAAGLPLVTVSDSTEIENAVRKYEESRKDGGTVEKQIGRISTVLPVSKEQVSEAFAESINKTMLLNDFAESVGISKDIALKNMIAAGMMVIKDEGDTSFIARINRETWFREFLTPDFYSEAKLKKFIELQIASSSNPEMVDLTLVRLERIILNSLIADKFIFALAAGSDPVSVVRQLSLEKILPTVTAAWKLNRAMQTADMERTPLAAQDIVADGSTDAYRMHGVDIGMSIPPSAAVKTAALEALKEYQRAMLDDMARGQFNYRGTGTRQTVQSFFEDYYYPTWYGQIRRFVEEEFNGGKTLKAIVTNGIGANDQFMWSLVEMYNRNRPEGAPVWYHIVTARDLAKLKDLDPETTLSIEISRSGSTWEGVEAAIRMVNKGFTKRITLANGGALVDIAKAEGVTSLIIGMSPDIGGRNMHRKTAIYYTAQTVAGMYLPQMDSSVFAFLNDYFDQANDFATQKNAAIAGGTFIHAAMKLLGVEHIALATNSKQLALIGSEWSQYVMEGSNKEDVISLAMHDLTREPENVLKNLASSPAGKISMAMVILDKAAPTYKSDAARVAELKTRMPVMEFIIDSRSKLSDNDVADGISQNQQAAFDILWTDMVTVLTSLLRVDANSNPNVKVVREMTASYVGKWEETAQRYATDAIGRKETDVLVSLGNPGTDEDQLIGVPQKQKLMQTEDDAIRLGRETARQLRERGLLEGRNRLNIFFGAEGLEGYAYDLRNYTYRHDLVKKRGWILDTGIYPLRAHKGHEATLAYSTDPKRPLLANKSVDIFLNVRKLGSEKFYNEPFQDITGKYTNVNGANVHQTNDSMTLPNIQRAAQVSPTILFEFAEMTPEIKLKTVLFYVSFIDEIAHPSVRSNKDGGTESVKDIVNELQGEFNLSFEELAVKISNAAANPQLIGKVLVLLVLSAMEGSHEIVLDDEREIAKRLQDAAKDFSATKTTIGDLTLDDFADIGAVRYKYDGKIVDDDGSLAALDPASLLETITDNKTLNENALRKRLGLGKQDGGSAADLAEEWFLVSTRLKAGHMSKTVSDMVGPDASAYAQRELGKVAEQIVSRQAYEKIMEPIQDSTQIFPERFYFSGNKKDKDYGLPLVIYGALLEKMHLEKNSIRDLELRDGEEFLDRLIEAERQDIYDNLRDPLNMSDEEFLRVFLVDLKISMFQELRAGAFKGQEGRRERLVNKFDVLVSRGQAILPLLRLKRQDPGLNSNQISFIEHAIRYLEKNSATTRQTAANSVLDGGVTAAQEDKQPTKRKVAGIDFRDLPIVTPQAAGPGNASSNASGVVLSSEQLKKQWQDIREHIQNGPMPYQEIKAYVLGCSQSVEGRAYLKEVSCCIAEILKLEEEAAYATAPELKEILACIG